MQNAAHQTQHRAFAIRQSMESYGFTEQEILDAIAAAGYKAGGRVGFRFGGIDEAIEKIVN
jgi:putative N-acetylmannosamine-6-phosphate epimerase